MADNRPRAREKNVTGGGAGVHRRGSGIGGGPVGGGTAFNDNGRGSSGGGKRNGGGGMLPIIVAVIAALFGGGAGLGGLLGGGGSAPQPAQAPQQTEAPAQNQAGSTGDFGSFFNWTGNGISSGWTYQANTGVLNREEAPEAREHFTKIRGNGEDTVTLMVYMCGTDLESKSGMATNDLIEMTKAKIGENVNILVYTGGCRGWKNDIISSRVNQVYKVENGGLKCLVKDDGTKPMTDSSTLSSFIRWSAKNYPADRNMLIFWDHGGGSLSGYGYDEKFASSGSMTLSGIQKALKSADMKFDWIGFDACLMATVENGLMLSNYADYMIASEETEPGIGWYYTNWLTELSNNTSMDTLDIGKRIADDFVDACASQCKGQKTTLSLVDLAELSQTVGDDFSAFAQDTGRLIENNEYRTVSSARSNAREFAQSSAIDQIDLIHFAKNMGTEAGEQLADTLLSAVKYNRTASNMTNAYGLSIYFPMKKKSSVNKAVQTYDAIGLDESYSDCIRSFAGLQMTAQAATGGTTNPGTSLFGAPSQGGYPGGNASGGYSTVSQEQMLELINLFLGGSGAVSGVEASGGSVFGRSIDPEAAAEYIAENRFKAENLVWEWSSDDEPMLSIPEDQWDLVSSVDLNVFYDDGEGYVDLGLDNLYKFDEAGDLIADADGTWLSINEQPVAYYHTDTTEDGDEYSITGYVPAFLNGERVKLVLIFDDENPDGYIAGADPDYEEGLTETRSRGLVELQPGDKLDFICDFYDYDGSYIDSYKLGEQMTVTEDMMISNTYLGGDFKAYYRFTDIYDQHYWTPEVPQ